MQNYVCIYTALVVQYMTVLVHAVITKYHRLGDLHNKKSIFSEFWKLESTRSRFWPIQFLVISLFPACRQPSSCCILRWPFLGASADTSLFLFLRGPQFYWIRTSPLPHLINNLNYSLKTLYPSKVILEIRISHMRLREETTFNS